MKKVSGIICFIGDVHKADGACQRPNGKMKNYVPIMNSHTVT